MEDMTLNTTIYEKLGHIQANLNAPKNLFNKFGGYKYRNAEGILEALKPFLSELRLIIRLSDRMVEAGGRVYVEATATLSDYEGNAITTTAYAREDETKKGMDGSQITGSSSSYARKYALNGLFAIDDTKDADSWNKGDGQPDDKPSNSEPAYESMPVERLISKAQIEELRALNANFPNLCGYYKVKTINELTEKQGQEAIAIRKGEKKA